MSDHSADETRGAQVERTVLSWNRIAIAIAANGALLARSGFVHGRLILEALGIAIAFAGFGLWTLSLARYSTIATRQARHLFGPRAGALPPLAAFVLLLSLIDLIAIVFAG